MPRSRPPKLTQPKLIQIFVALKRVELNAFAAMLRRSLRSTAVVGPIEWVTHLAELATLDDLSGRLEEDCRHLAGADSVPQPIRCNETRQ